MQLSGGSGTETILDHSVGPKFPDTKVEAQGLKMNRKPHVQSVRLERSSQKPMNTWSSLELEEAGRTLFGVSGGRTALPDFGLLAWGLEEDAYLTI